MAAQAASPLLSHCTLARNKKPEHVREFLPHRAFGALFLCHVCNESSFLSHFDARDALRAPNLLKYVCYVGPSRRPFLRTALAAYACSITCGRGGRR